MKSPLDTIHGDSWGESSKTLNKLQKLEDALVKQMLTAADRADQAERDDRTDLAEVAAG